jgi:NADH dehydrogenase
MGVEVRTGARVNEVTRDGVRLADACFVPAELVVWAAGSQSALVLRDFDGLEVNRINQLAAEPTLKTSRNPDI